MAQSKERMREVQKFATELRRQKVMRRQHTVAQPSSHRLIVCSGGQHVWVDAVDYPGLAMLSWRVNHSGYAITDEQPAKMHRRIMENYLSRSLERCEQVDHVNHNRIDNRRSNLRLVTNQQNGFNKLPVVATSAYKGVYWVKQKQQWCASISISGQKIHCGFFVEEIEAAYRYDQFAMQLFGQYAYLNVVGS